MPCLIGADGLAFVSLNTNKELFLNHVSGEDSGCLSPKHSTRYFELSELFDKHLKGEITRMQFLDQMFSASEIRHLTEFYQCDLMTIKVYKELEA
jgi:hypothetical protein